MSRPESQRNPDRAGALAAYLKALDAGAFFEAHETLEAFWLRYRGDDRDFYKGLIQVAVALHHLASGNSVGARGVAGRAREHLARYAPRHATLDVNAILGRLPPA